jgi:hypothetical protein
MLGGGFGMYYLGVGRFGFANGKSFIPFRKKLISWGIIKKSKEETNYETFTPWNYRCKNYKDFEIAYDKLLQIRNISIAPK